MLLIYVRNFFIDFFSDFKNLLEKRFFRVIYPSAYRVNITPHAMNSSGVENHASAASAAVSTAGEKIVTFSCRQKITAYVIVKADVGCYFFPRIPAYHNVKPVT